MKIAAIIAVGLAALGAPLHAQNETFVVDYIVTPQNFVVQVMRPQSDERKECASIDASAITPEQVTSTGAFLNGWSFVQSDQSQGYVTWTSEKSGAHTVFLANYVLRNCALSEIRYKQRTFLSDNRYEAARDAYNALMLETLGVADRP